MSTPKPSGEFSPRRFAADFQRGRQTPPPTPPTITASSAPGEPPAVPGPGWYLTAVLLPIVGLILGIVAASRSQTGPALGLWATSLFVAPVAWVVFWIVVVANA